MTFSNMAATIVIPELSVEERKERMKVIERAAAELLKERKKK